MSCSISPRIGPSPTMTNSKSKPRSRNGAAAWIRIGWPFCSAIRPMLTSLAAEVIDVWAVFQMHRAEPDPDDMDLGPCVVVDPPVELAAGEFADRDHERCASGLLIQCKQGRPIELVWTVNGEAVGNALRTSRRAWRPEPNSHQCGCADAALFLPSDARPGKPLRVDKRYRRIHHCSIPGGTVRRTSLTASRNFLGAAIAVLNPDQASFLKPASKMNSVCACSWRIASLTSSLGSDLRIENVCTTCPIRRSCSTSRRM